jgi:TolB-like protein/tetratricopeptide (TPR) repeat protein/tRNA A-37 threonylcarbamoyl transferase component Bud32
MMNKPTEASHSVADRMEDLVKCPRCGATTQFDHGTCINCFLREGIEAKGEGSRETFESILLEANVTDTKWRLGHYEILEEIGRGGMGVIYRARQQHSRRIVAVKRMLSHQVNSHETLVRFRREAEAVASLDHPNILPIHEVSESEEGLPYFSMKYATGGSLRVAAPTLRNAPRECVRLMTKVARAIAYAHAKGVLHRDLQPGNILLDENSEPMVSDFGLAKWLDQTSDLTRTLEALGTPGYIAPEQTECSADKLTSAADVYSLGAILFYLLSGRPPFVGQNVLHVIHQAAATPAPCLRSLVPSLDRDLETIVARCLEREPQMRYPTAGELAVDLERWVEGRPIMARRVSPPVRAWRWSKRNPKLAAATAAAFCSAMAAAFLFFSHEGLSPLAAFAAAAIAFCSAIAVLFLFFSRKTTPFFAAPEKSIAVLPFLSMSSDPENEYLSDGLTEDLIMAFSRLKGLRVPARTSSFAFKGKNEDICRIGQQLNVTKILQGSVRKVGDRLRITAQLINVADGDHLWAQTFDSQMQEVFAIQDEITRAIVRAFEMQLIGAGGQPLTKHGTYNTDAYQLYLQARYHFHKFTEEGFRRCIECCKKALKIEPNYALAYAALSLCYQTGWFYGFLSFEEKLAAIGPHDLFAEKALELDPNLAETQTALGIVRCWNERDWSRGEDCFKRAIKLNPNYVTAHEHYGAVLACRRRIDEAITHARFALQIDPLSPMVNLHAGLVYWFIHRYDLLLEQAHRLFDLESNFFGTYWLLGWAHWSQGMHEAAVADLRKAVTLGGGPIQLADLGCLLGLLGRKAEAQQVLEELNEFGKRRYVQPAYRGFVHASLGNYDEAFACFAQGIEHENASIAYLREYCICAGLDGLLADPRFPALLKKIGLEA